MHKLHSKQLNKSVQNTFGRGPRRGVIAHVRRKVSIGYNGTPQIRPQKYPSRGPIPNPTTCLGATEHAGVENAGVSRMERQREIILRKP